MDEIHQLAIDADWAFEQHRDLAAFERTCAALGAHSAAGEIEGLAIDHENCEDLGLEQHQMDELRGQIWTRAASLLGFAFAGWVAETVND